MFLFLVFEGLSYTGYTAKALNKQGGHRAQYTCPKRRESPN